MRGNDRAGLSDVVKERFAEMRAKQQEFTATAELREVLPQLYTDEARAALIETLAYQYNIPNGYIQQAVNHYIATDNSNAKWLTYLDTNSESAFVAVEEQLGWKIRKESDDQRAKRDAIQARVAKPTRDLSSEEYDLARKEIDITKLETDEALYIIDLWEQTNRIEQAAEAARKIGVPVLGVEIYERRGYFEDAAQTAEQAGMLERALQDYEACNNHGQAGQVAEKVATQKRTERQKSKGIQSMLYEAVAGAYTPEEQKIIERAITNYEKAGWVEQAVSLAEKINNSERVISIYENAGKAEAAAEYALKKGMTKKFLEICEKEGHYEIAEGIAKETQQKERAQLYEKVDAIIKYGHDMDLYRERRQFFLDLESMTAEAGNNDEEGDGKEERKNKTREQKRGEQGILTYCKRRIAELRDCILVEGTYEAIKTLCGVDTTGQLIQKMTMPAISLMGLVGSCTTYIAHDEPKPEAPQIVYESREQIPTPPDIAVEEKYPPQKVPVTYQTQKIEQKITRGCSH